MNALPAPNSKYRVLFYPLAKFYELAIRLRLIFYRVGIFRIRPLPVPVISVGNITVGGTGKTPCTAYLANYLQQQKLHVAILSRGYKRESKGIVEVSDGKNILCTARESGDEPYLLAQKCKGARIIVNADRYEAGRWLLAKNSVDVFLLDDGYQHIQLARKLNILLMDATEALANYELLPIGKLREPLNEMRRADAVIITRSDQCENLTALQTLIHKKCRPNISVFFAQHKITSFKLVSSNHNASNLAQISVAALACIAKPEQFWDLLRQQKLDLVLHQSYPDHHRYSVTEFEQFVQRTLAAKAEAIIITEKDFANIPTAALQNSKLPVYVSELEFTLENEAAFQQLIMRLWS